MRQQIHEVEDHGDRAWLVQQRRQASQHGLAVARRVHLLVVGSERSISKALDLFDEQLMFERVEA